MADQFDEQVMQLFQRFADEHSLSGVFDEDARYNWPDRWDNLRPAVAAALRKQAFINDGVYQGMVKENDDLRREVERLQRELLIIGDMAVADWNDPVVGAVDAVITVAPKTYMEYRQAELAKYEAMKAEIAALKTMNQRLWAVLTTEERHKLNLKYENK